MLGKELKNSPFITFKPFAAIGFEYHQVAPDSGGATLGSEVRFSIPQFGDQKKLGLSGS